MVRKSAQDRRVEVLNETLNQIQLLGMSAVRVADVAEAAGVSASLIIYHFRTKENLIAEALILATERDLSTLGRVVRDADTPVDRLLGALNWYAPTGEARGWQIWIDAWSAAMRDRALAKVLGQLQERWIAAVAELIDEGVAAGDFRTDDPVGAASRLTALLDGLAVRYLAEFARPSHDDIRRWLLRQLAGELGVAENVLTAPRRA